MALIYIVEDDLNIREIESIALKNSNYTVSAFDCAEAFFGQMAELLPDLVILDIMLPDQDGYEIMRKMRKNPLTAKIPIIIVTAKTTEMDLVKSLDSGADDYIRKPFSIMELLSRVRALLRRTAESAPKVLTVGEIRLDQERYLVYAGETQVELTFKEFELLRFLMINPKVVLSREAIMQAVWDTDYEGETRTVDMHIKTLRQKLGSCGKQIGTVRNVGYVIS
ncbi:MAG: response regulator transcription factor [Lachnospiraceae bacterium]|jgi:two-component system alkaline phosphatase synthesis response regulator PhoP|nr:response regulator transcription factor [Lachnospiraceae bacterium]